MVNITRTIIDTKGRIQLPATFILANNLRHGQVIILKPMINKDNSIALIWKNKTEEK